MRAEQFSESIAFSNAKDSGGAANDAYFHLPIAPHHRPYLRFAFEGRAYQYRVLPFGLSIAPMIFTRCIRAALAPISPPRPCGKVGSYSQLRQKLSNT